MPRMSGTAAARELRRRFSSSTLYGLTGDPVGCAERREFEDSGLDACFDKGSDGLAKLSELIAAYADEQAADDDADLTTVGGDDDVRL